MALHSPWSLMRLHGLLMCTLILNHTYFTACAESADKESYVEVESDDESALLLDNIKVFYPTNEWQTIHPDDVVFTGLHYRINIATGLKEAKLLDGNNGAEYYRLLEQWLKDVKAGRQKPGQGGFKITKSAKSLVKSGISSSPIGCKDCGSADGATAVQKKKSASATKNTGGDTASYDLALVPDTEKQSSQHTQDEKVSSSNSRHTEKHEKEDFFADLLKLDDFHSSFDEKVKSLKTEAPTKDNQQGGTSQEPGHEGSPPKFRTYAELKKDLEELELLIEDEQHIVSKLVKAHHGLTSEESKEQSLIDIEYLLHNIDNAKVFIDIGGLTTVAMPSLNSSSLRLQALACRVVSSCVQNNPAGQVAAHQAGVLGQLVRLLWQHVTSTERARVLSSIASAVRQFPLAQRDLLRDAGSVLWQILTQEPATHDDLNAKTKVTLLLADLIEERASLQKEEGGERASQLAAVGLEGFLHEQGWCDHLVRAITDAAFEYLPDDDQKAEPVYLPLLDSLVYAASASSYDVCPASKLQRAAPFLQVLETHWRRQARQSDEQDMTEYYEDRRRGLNDLLSSITWDKAEL